MILALKTDLMRHSMKITKIQYASNYIHFLTEAVTGQTLFRHLVEFDHPGMSSRDPSSGSTGLKHHPLPPPQKKKTVLHNLTHMGDQIPSSYIPLGSNHLHHFTTSYAIPLGNKATCGHWIHNNQH